MIEEDCKDARLLLFERWICTSRAVPGTGNTETEVKGNFHPSIQLDCAKNAANTRITPRLLQCAAKCSTLNLPLGGFQNTNA